MTRRSSERPLVAVATITWARSPAEDRHLRRSLLRLAGTGVPVAIADTGRVPAFTSFLREHAAFVVTVESRGLVPQVEASLRLALECRSRFVLYTEPDKDCFFEHLGAFLRRATRLDGLAIAARSARSFATYPRTQRFTERVINQLCGEAVGCTGDYSYGPFLFPHAFARHLLPLPPHLGWGWRHYAFRQAGHKGLRIRHVRGDYVCPVDQRAENASERAHRLRQLSQNVQGLLA